MRWVTLANTLQFNNKRIENRNIDFRVKAMLLVKLETLIVNLICFDEDLIITKPTKLFMLGKFCFFNEVVSKVAVNKGCYFKTWSIKLYSLTF